MSLFRLHYMLNVSRPLKVLIYVLHILKYIKCFVVEAIDYTSLLFIYKYSIYGYVCI